MTVNKPRSSKRDGREQEIEPVAQAFRLGGVYARRPHRPDEPDDRVCA